MYSAIKKQSILRNKTTQVRPNPAKKNNVHFILFYLSTVFFSKGTENFLAQPVKIIYLDSIKIRVQVRGFSEFCLLRC